MNFSFIEPEPTAHPPESVAEFCSAVSPLGIVIVTDFETTPKIATFDEGAEMLAVMLLPVEIPVMQLIAPGEWTATARFEPEIVTLPPAEIPE